jgi:hypothetical protein
MRLPRSDGDPMKRGATSAPVLSPTIGHPVHPGVAKPYISPPSRN